MKTCCYFLFFYFCVIAFPAIAVSVDAHPKLQQVVNELVVGGIYKRRELNKIIQRAEYSQTVLDAMTRPAEFEFTWGKYRTLFLQQDRIRQGVDFWNKYADDFQRVETRYGVPAEVVAAILGVESKYGRFLGQHRILDSLTTLVIGFERRREFFAAELKHFLQLCKENQLDPYKIKGSYAGAMGYPQFIASSYRNLATDFNGDGRIDLIGDPVDAIGSIAHYLSKNGWRRGESIVSSARKTVPDAVRGLASRKRQAVHSAGDLRKRGAQLADTIKDTDKVGVLELNINETPPQDPDSAYYIVRAGDTACEIAERFAVPCRELFRLNKLNQRGDIFRGQKLSLPKTVKRQSESSKWQISRRNAAANEINRYYYARPNFYVITTYNQSVLYAMAVVELSRAIAKQRSSARK